MSPEGRVDARRKPRVPAVNGLIFVRSSQEELTRLKMTKSEFEPLRYMVWRSREIPHQVHEIPDQVRDEGRRVRDEGMRGGSHIITVPDGEMTNFMRVYERVGEKAAVLEYTDFIAKAGKRVRVTQGDFAGTVGTIVSRGDADG